MDPVEDVEIGCPYCGEYFAVSIDTTHGRVDLIEDCAVCCRPIQLSVRCADGFVESIDVSRA